MDARSSIHAEFSDGSTEALYVYRVRSIGFWIDLFSSFSGESGGVSGIMRSSRDSVVFSACSSICSCIDRNFQIREFSYVDFVWNATIFIH